MPPLNLLIKPASSLCNMRCKYCFYGDVSEMRSFESFGMMSEETLETLVKRAFEYADGQIGFAFQGGEPTLAGIDFYRKLIDLEKQYNTKKGHPKAPVSDFQIKNKLQIAILYFIKVQ